MARTNSLPEIGLGTYSEADPEMWTDTVATALELGYRHVDTAQMYENEAYVGDGLEKAKVPSEEVVVSTKVVGENLAYDDVLDSVDASRDRLGIETIDVLYVHWPRKAYDAPETLAAFDELYDEGVIRNVGLSNFTPDLLEEAKDVLDAPLFAHQVEFHPLFHQDELLADAQENDYYLVAYSPLSKGKVFDVPEISDIARKHDTIEAAVSLAWLTSKEQVVVIPKASSREHLRQNLEAAELELDDEDVERIDDLSEGERLVDFDDAPWNVEREA